MEYPEGFMVEKWHKEDSSPEEGIVKSFFMKDLKPSKQILGMNISHEAVIDPRSFFG